MGEFIVNGPAGPKKFNIKGSYPTPDEITDMIAPQYKQFADSVSAVKQQDTAGSAEQLTDTVKQAQQGLFSIGGQNYPTSNVAPSQLPPMAGGGQIPVATPEPTQGLFPLSNPGALDAIREHVRAVELAKARLGRDQLTLDKVDNTRNAIETALNVSGAFAAGAGAAAAFETGGVTIPAAVAGQGLRRAAPIIAKRLAGRFAPTLGGALTQAVGDVAFDSALKLGVEHGVFPPAALNGNTPTYDRVKSNLLMNLAVGWGLDAGTGTLGGAWAALRGTPEAQAIKGRLASAASIGIKSLGIQDVSNSAAFKLFNKTVGSYPYVGGLARKAQATRYGEIEQGARTFLFDSFAPLTAMSDLGDPVVAAVGKQFQFMRDHAVSFYDRARELGQQAGPIFDMANTTRTGSQVVDQMEAHAVASGVTRSSTVRSEVTSSASTVGSSESQHIAATQTRVNGGPVVDTTVAQQGTEIGSRNAEHTTVRDTSRETFQLGQVPSFDETSGVSTFIDRVANIKGPLTTEQVVGLSKNINDAMRHAEGEQKVFLYKIRNAFEQDLEAPANADIGGLIKQGNSEYARVMKMYEGGVPDQFRRVNKNIFTGSKYAVPGDLYSDQVMGTVLSGKYGNSADALMHLKTLLANSPALYERSLASGISGLVTGDNVRKFVELSPDKSTLKFDFTGLRESLGLHSPVNDRRSLLNKAFSLAGKPGQLSKIDDFLTKAEANMGEAIPNMSEMQRRRLQFGLGAASTGLFGIYAVEKQLAVGGLGTAIAVATGARYFGSYLASPARLNALSKTFDTTIPSAVRRNAAQQLVRFAAEDLALTQSGGRPPTSQEVNSAMADLNSSTLAGQRAAFGNSMLQQAQP